MNKIANFSTQRLPGDNFLSGALLGLMVSGSTNLNAFENNQKTKQEAIKDTIKFSLQTAIATGFAVKTANNIVRKNYSSALLNLAVGASLIYLTQKI